MASPAEVRHTCYRAAAWLMSRDPFQGMADTDLKTQRLGPFKGRSTLFGWQMALIVLGCRLQGGKKTPGGGKSRKRKADEGASQAHLQLAGILQLMSQLEHDLVGISAAGSQFHAAASYNLLMRSPLQL